MELAVPGIVYLPLFISELSYKRVDTLFDILELELYRPYRWVGVGYRSSDVSYIKFTDRWSTSLDTMTHELQNLTSADQTARCYHLAIFQQTWVVHRQNVIRLFSTIAVLPLVGAVPLDLYPTSRSSEKISLLLLYDCKSFTITV